MLIKNIAHGWTGDKDGTRLTGAIRIEGGIITEIGDLVAKAGEEVLDASGCVVTPGMINTHHHLFQSALKGLAINQPLDPWLEQVPYTYWPRLDEESLRVSARIGLAELALSGVSTVCDHHYVFSDRYDYDPAEVLFEEAARFGIRFVLARGGMSRGRDFGAEVPAAPVESVPVFLQGIETAAKRWNDPSPDAMTRVACAPTTPNFNFAPETLPEIAQEARHMGVRLHAHLSENTAYAAQTQRAFGLRPVPWLAKMDWLGSDVWFAHLVDITADEITLLAETGTAMSHCPQANARLGSGIAPAPALHAAGGTVSMAVDGAGANEAADMGSALYTAFALHRAAHGVEAIDAGTLLHWATMGGAKALDLPAVGRIAPGMAADISLFDLSDARNFGLHDPALAPMVSGAAKARDVMVAGRFVLRNGRLPHLELGALAEDARRITERLARVSSRLPA
ncbi:amidohydrolase family protein [Falsihalocynthiibacter sp. SS001]|uniref:amidohydrolase family protein n=1 Tax=Falsihalocynthiibacter sp. SS001 TaxID=3349698 RepID=UPI0036D308CB